jgi:hypothetical protein
MTDRIKKLQDRCWDVNRGEVDTRKLAYLIIQESAQQASMYFNSESLQQKYDIEEYLLHHWNLD